MGALGRILALSKATVRANRRGKKELLAQLLFPAYMLGILSLNGAESELLAAQGAVEQEVNFEVAVSQNSTYFDGGLPRQFAVDGARGCTRLAVAYDPQGVPEGSASLEKFQSVTESVKEKLNDRSKFPTCRPPSPYCPEPSFWRICLASSETPHTWAALEEDYKVTNSSIAAAVRFHAIEFCLGAESGAGCTPSVNYTLYTNPDRGTNNRLLGLLSKTGVSSASLSSRWRARVEGGDYAPSAPKPHPPTALRSRTPGEST